MKRRLLLILSAVMLLAALCTAGALAEGETEYEVGSPETWESAISKITSSDETSATIVLTGDVNIGTAPVGVDGADITITSDGGALLTTSGDELHLVGNVTFTNVNVSAKTIYAEGHKLVLDKGFGGGEDGRQRMIVYGGSDDDLKADTHVEVYSGVYKLIAGGNSAGTLTGDTYVLFGGDAKFPTAADGEEEGDHSTGSGVGYNLYFAAEYDFKEVSSGGWIQYETNTKIGYLPYGIYGGGVCGNTVGNTTVEMTGGEVFQIFGGGAARRNPSDEYATAEEQVDQLLNLGRVSGSTSVTVTGGEVKSVYGGGYNDITVYSGDDHKNTIPENARKERAVVTGDTYVEISGNAHVPVASHNENDSTSGSDFPAVYGGSFCSTVHNTEVIIGGNVVIENGGPNGVAFGYGVVFGAGRDDIVKGTTFVKLTGDAVIGNDSNTENITNSTVSQKHFSAITPLGRSSTASYMNGAKGYYTCEIQNIEGKDYAAVAEVNGGSVDVLMAGGRSRNTKQYPNTVSGNVQLVLSDGTVKAIEAGSIEEKEIRIKGNVDILIKGGTVERYILGHYPSFGEIPDPEENITGQCTLTFDSCGSAEAFQMSPLIQFVDSVRVTNSSKVAVVGDHYVYDYDANKQITDVPLWSVTDLTIDEGSTLAFEQDAEIGGDLVVNGQLGLARTNYIIKTTVTTLTAEGTATGEGTLFPFKGALIGEPNYSEFSTPVVNEEYVYALTEGSDMTLTLANAGDTGLYVDVRDKSTTQSAWYIAQGEVLWYYEVYYEWYEDGELSWTLWKSGQGGWTEVPPDQIVSIGPEEWDNEDLGWGEMLGVHYVYDENYGEHRLSAKAGEATEDNPLKIYYRLAPHTITYEYDTSAPADAEPPAQEDTFYTEEVTVPNPTIAGYTFGGWTVKLPENSDDILDDGVLTMPNADVTLVGTWTELPKVKVAPADITIYMGGTAYEGTVVDGETGGLITDRTDAGFPEPGFTIKLPEGVSAEVTALEFKEAGGSGKTWKLVPYDGNSTTVYKLVPQGTGQKPTRVQFELNGKLVTSDNFTVGEHVNQTLKMSLYKGDVGTITVEIGDKTYLVDSSAAATLTVRGTTENEQYATAGTTFDQTSNAGEPGLTAPTGTTYTINDSDVKANASSVALLFDDIIEESAGSTERAEALAEKGDKKLGAVGANREYAYEFKYLDLVDRNNGNVWVKASNDVTVYWPLPEGADATTLKVLHFKDLHREMDSDSVESAIEGCDVEVIESEVTDTHVVFEIGEAGFSPFALVWEEAIPTASLKVEKIADKVEADVGDTINFTITVTNTGSVALTDITVTDDFTGSGTLTFELPDGVTGSDGTFTIASLPAGESVVIEAAYTVPSADAGETLTNTADASVSMGGSVTMDSSAVNVTVNEPDDDDDDKPIVKPPKPDDDDDEPEDVVPPMLNGDDHFAYVIGYEDGTVKPDGQIIRAEVATIIFRLLDPDVRDENLTSENGFTDVSEGDWYNTAISTLVELGIIEGRSDTIFDPNAPITRAEFATLFARFDESGVKPDGGFADVKTHWAREYIERAAALGWINGYEDGTFRPDSRITRAEAMTMINRVLNREPEDEGDLLSDMRVWSDNKPGTWYYLAVQEATNSHDYTRHNAPYEHWTELTADPDWERYQ